MHLIRKQSQLYFEQIDLCFKHVNNCYTKMKSLHIGSNGSLCFEVHDELVCDFAQLSWAVTVEARVNKYSAGTCLWSSMLWALLTQHWTAVGYCGCRN